MVQSSEHIGGHSFAESLLMIVSAFRNLGLLTGPGACLLVGMFLGVAPSRAEMGATKNLSAPPEEFLSGALRLPDPAHAGVRSVAAMIPVHLDATDSGTWRWSGHLEVDADDALSIMLFAPGGQAWDILLTPPRAEPIDVKSPHDGVRITRRRGAVGLGLSETGESFTIDAPPVGRWAVRLSASEANVMSGGRDGYLMFAVKSPYALYTHLSDYELVVGRQVGFVSYLYDRRKVSSGSDSPPIPLVGRNMKAEMHVVKPSGVAKTVPLRAKNDGTVSGSFRADEAGDYTARIVVRSESIDGAPLLRTSQHFFTVVEQTAVLGRTARGTQIDDGRLRFDVAIQHAAGAGKMLLTAELWGKGDGQSNVSVCWLSRMADPRSTAVDGTLPLWCDTRWVRRAGAQPPFQLHHVRLQDPDTHIPFSRRDVMPVETDFAPVVAVDGYDREIITREMLMGVPGPTADFSENVFPPMPLAEAGAPCSTNTLHKVMLVHGYCSGGVWPTGEFDDAIEFADNNQNRTHDQFAQLIRAQGGGLKSFGIVAHSQGGAASLHLFSYYWSGLDYSTGPRRIQSVGTPYRGTPLAGDLAILGEIFGSGCGTNFDMTYDGAALWLSGIPSWARSEVYYHTTSFEDGFGFDFCSLFTDLFLTDPDDGVIEMDYGQLPGANNMGHTEGWCHTTGMRDPAQYEDHSRNAVMNANANR